MRAPSPRRQLARCSQHAPRCRLIPPELKTGDITGAIVVDSICHPTACGQIYWAYTPDMQQRCRSLGPGHRAILANSDPPLREPRSFDCVGGFGKLLSRDFRRDKQGSGRGVALRRGVNSVCDPGLLTWGLDKEFLCCSTSYPLPSVIMFRFPQ